MDPSLNATPRLAGAEAARSAIAAAMLCGLDSPPRVGDVTLWPRQRAVLERVLAAIEDLGGALLADDVGSGKTFVALAAASRFAAPLVVAPAALRDAWARALKRAAIDAPFVSVESLSRGLPRSAGEGPDFVIVDEAHHARNPTTRRHAALARLTAHAPILLLTATPIHNGTRDLHALLSLFLGERAYRLDDPEIARCVIRGEAPDAADRGCGLPRLDGPRSLSLRWHDDAIAESILALPPAVPPDDGGVAHALSLLTLLRQWSSSEGALRAAIRRRLAAGEALRDMLAAGRRPTRRELSLWTFAEDAQQLAFAGLLGSPLEKGCTGWAADRLRAHLDALAALLERCRARPSPDVARAEALRRLFDEHAGEKVIAFTQFAETAHAYWRELRAVPGVAMLGARGGVVAGGPLSRRDVLCRFSPRSLAAPEPARPDRIDCLITTDILSEGLDLQDASVVVHLDLPWTPARLEQRVGRLLRPGSRHERVLVRTMPAPARSETLLRIDARLHAKLAAARGTLGHVLAFATGGAPPAEGTQAPVAAGERIARALARWRGHPAPERPALGVVAAPIDGWLAAIARGGRVWLVARLAGTTSVRSEHVAQACLLAEGEERSRECSSQAVVSVALGEIERWIAADDAARLAGIDAFTAEPGRVSLARAASAVARLPRSRRSAVAARADALRALAVEAAGAGREAELRAIAASGIDAVPDAMMGARRSDFRPARLLAAVVFSSGGGHH